MSSRVNKIFLPIFIASILGLCISWSTAFSSTVNQPATEIIPPLSTPLPSDAQRPNADNTGYSGTLTPYSGPSTITVNGTILENFSYSGTLKIQANNVTLRNFLIDSTSFYGIDAKYGATGLIIEDGEIAHTQSAAIVGSNFIARRLHIRDQGADAFKPFQNVLIQGNYIRNLGTIPDAHSDGVQMVVGNNVVIHRNHFAPSDGSDYHTSQVIILQTNNGPVDRVAIEDNWIYDGGWAVQVRDKGNGYGPPTNISIVGNRFGNDHHFGPWATDGNVTVSCNVWDETDELIEGQAECSATAESTPTTPEPELSVTPTPVTPTPAPPTGSITMPDPFATVDPLVASGSVTGQLFVDQNRNGQLEKNEPFLPNAVIILADAETDGQTLTRTISTDETGGYFFADIPSADYIITFDLPTGYATPAETNIQRITVGTTASTAEVTLTAFGIILSTTEVYLPLLIKPGGL